LIFFTSDPHFFHKNIIQYSNRPYADVGEMNEALIINWNSKVKPEDTVYLLGDVSFGDEKGTSRVFDRLNGSIKLCYGNHDQVIKKNKSLQNRFSDIREYYELKFNMVDGAPNMIVMCHFPMITWNKAHRGSWMLHGHCHGSLKYPFPARIMDVGIDPCKYFPISIVEVEKHMRGIEPQAVDHHTAAAD
jgi:calcineurin-like phosphoesterase family protein